MSVAGTSVDSPRKCSVGVDPRDTPAPLSRDGISTALLISRGTARQGAAKMANCLAQFAGRPLSSHARICSPP